jgi:GH18 family chitinase
MKSLKILLIPWCLLTFIFLLPTNVFPAIPTGPQLTTEVIGAGLINPSGGIFKKNNIVKLEAVPDAGWRFDHWEGDLTGTANPTTIRMTTDKHIIAVFLEEGVVQEYTLTTHVSGEGQVTPAGGSYPQGTVVQIQADPLEGWKFFSWQGDLTGTSNPSAITMDADKQITAVFIEQGTPPPPGEKEVVGYFIEWGIYQRNYLVKNIVTSGSADILTIINYAFAGIGDNLKCEILDPYADYTRRYDASESVDGVADTATQPLKGNFNQLKKLKAMYPNIKVLISIGGWTDSDRFSDAALPENRVAFVASCIDMFIKGQFDPVNGVMDANLFDGIDIDWEYPGACGLTCNYRPEDTANFTALLAEFRKQMDAVKPGLLLTIAAPASAYYYSKIELDKIHSSLDLINIMVYDFHGSWEPSGPTNHHANLYASTADPSIPPMSADGAVRGYLAASVPAEKISLGLPFYGRGWGSVPNVNNGLYQRAGRLPRGTWEKGVEDYKVLKNKRYPGFWDDQAKAYWIYDGATFWTYDNEVSINAKMGYVDNQGLGGVMFWELSGDDSQGTLIHAIDTGLKRR